MTELGPNENIQKISDFGYNYIGRKTKPKSPGTAQAKLMKTEEGAPATPKHQKNNSQTVFK